VQALPSGCAALTHWPVAGSKWVSWHAVAGQGGTARAVAVTGTSMGPTCRVPLTAPGEVGAYETVSACESPRVSVRAEGETVKGASMETASSAVTPPWLVTCTVAETGKPTQASGRASGEGATTSCAGSSGTTRWPH
jgi:hypothetical protein